MAKKPAAKKAGDVPEQSTQQPAPKDDPQAAAPKPSGGLMSYCNTSSLAVLMLFAYIFYVGAGFRRIMNPLIRQPEPGEMTLDPLWGEGLPFELTCFISTSPEDPSISAGPIWKETGLNYTWTASATPDRPLTLVPPGSVEPNGTVVKDPRFWAAVRSGQEVYLHVFATLRGGSVNASDAAYNPVMTLHGVVPLIKREVRKPPRAKRRLLDGVVIQEPDLLMDGDMGLFWKPEVAVRLVADFTVYPINEVPAQIGNHLDIIDLAASSAEFRRRRSNVGRYRYKPPMHVDEMSLTSDKWVGLNDSIALLPLRVSYSPMSLQRWQLMSVLEESMRSQKSLGIEDKDIDDLRRLITDTNIVLLAVTILASLLHLLFEFLAFQSDIHFWRSNRSLRGLSVRSVVLELVCQSVILLFLIETDTSLLVIVPSAFGILVQVWKVKKATGVTLRRTLKGGVRIAFLRLEEEAQGEGKEEGEEEVKGEGKKEEGKEGKEVLVKTEGEGTKEGQKKEGKEGKEVVVSKNREKEQGGEKKEGKGKVVSKKGGKKEEGKEVKGMDKTAGAAEAEGRREAEAGAETMQLDRLAINHLSLVLAPAVLGFAAKSLLFEEHASWYAWAISTLTGAVYAFGFILMTPQLFINYKLKSVSHLPWRFLCYRFLNTFIDDLFAFIIKMPTMHRISCFRDDVVFIIYLYQRWIYKVDETRRTDAEDCPSS